MKSNKDFFLELQEKEYYRQQDMERQDYNERLKWEIDKRIMNPATKQKSSSVASAHTSAPTTLFTTKKSA